MAIRFDRKFNQEIRREVDRINKKIRYAKQTGKTRLPRLVSTKELKARYSSRYATRAELRRELAAYRKATIADLSKQIELEDGGRISLFAYRETERKRIRLLRLAKRDLQSMRDKTYDSSLIFAKARTNTLENIVSELQKGSRTSEYQMQKIAKMYAQEFSSEKKDSFENALFDTIAEHMKFNGLSDAENRALMQKLQQIDINQLIKMNREDEDFAEILDRYKKHGTYTDVDQKTIQDAYRNIYDKLDQLIEDYKK